MITTYTRLIKGMSLSVTICDLLAKKAHKSGDLETERYYKKESEAHLEALSHYTMLRRVIGDEVRIVG